jgi:hypothetical protein
MISHLRDLIAQVKGDIPWVKTILGHIDIGGKMIGHHPGLMFGVADKQPIDGRIKIAKGEDGQKQDRNTGGNQQQKEDFTSGHQILT